MDKKNPGKMEVATLGGGCFWCTEAVFSELKGVVKIEPGYSGGSLANPTYEQVSTGTTGHAGVVQITFDRGIVKVLMLAPNIDQYYFTMIRNRKQPLRSLLRN